MLTKEQAQKRRYLKRLEQMLKKHYLNEFFYLTFTFNNKTLETTTEETRLRYIKAFLNEQAKEYLLNKDYGAENQREHYHAVVIPKYKAFISYHYKYGFLKVEKIKNIFDFRFKSNDSKNTLQRITDHAFKDTTKSGKVIYSRIRPINQEPTEDFKRLVDSHLEKYINKIESKREDLIKYAEIIDA